MIVAVTGTALDEDIAAFYSAGADLVLQKPLEMKVIHSLVRFVRTGYKHHVGGKILDFEDPPPQC